MTTSKDTAPADNAEVRKLEIDWRKFNPSAIADATRRCNAEIERLCHELPAVESLPPEVTRQARREGRGLFPQIGQLPEGKWLDFSPPPGGIGRLRVLEPAGTPRGVYLHIHGGGWTFGAPDIFDDQNLELVRATGLVTLSVSYRLAPEHPWPAAVDDCVAALEYVVGESGRLFDTEWIAIGGESAGAHLAALALLRGRQAGLTERVSAAVLTYGCYDLRMTPSMANWGERRLVLSTPAVKWFADNFVPEERLKATPEVSPLLADLSGMPPALFAVGTLDPLVDDSIFMAGRWAAAGAPAELELYPGGVHAFDAFDVPIAVEYRATVHKYLKRQLERES